MKGSVLASAPYAPLTDFFTRGRNYFKFFLGGGNIPPSFLNQQGHIPPMPNGSARLWLAVKFINSVMNFSKVDKQVLKYNVNEL